MKKPMDVGPSPILHLKSTRLLHTPAFCGRVILSLDEIGTRNLSVEMLHPAGSGIQHDKAAGPMLGGDQ
jgi:hypothetical protein